MPEDPSSGGDDKLFPGLAAPTGSDLISRFKAETIIKALTGGREPFIGSALLFSEIGWIHSEANLVERLETDIAAASASAGTLIYSVILFGPDDAVFTDDGRAFWIIPTPMDGYELADVHAEVVTAGTGGGPMEIQIFNVAKNLNLFETANPLEIDAGELGSDTAASPFVLEPGQEFQDALDVLRFDIDVVHNTPALGLILNLTFENPN